MFTTGSSDPRPHPGSYQLQEDDGIRPRVQEPVVELALVPLRYSTIQDVAVDTQADLREWRYRVGLQTGSEGGEGSAGPEGHLQGTDHPTAVRGLHPTGGHRIQIGQPGVEPVGVGVGIVAAMQSAI